MAEFIQSNWFWILLVLAFVGMHAFGVGCCGGQRHSRRKTDGQRNRKGRQEAAIERN